MIDPSEIVDNLVELLQDIPDLVELVGGDEERIFAYHDRYPEKCSIERAKYELPSPAVMVAWVGTAPGGFGGIDVWRHELSITLRARPVTNENDPPDDYYRFFRMITKGVPTSSGQPMSNITVHASCNPMDVPSIRRQSDVNGVDYFEVLISFTEMGDD